LFCRDWLANPTCAAALIFVSPTETRIIGSGHALIKLNFLYEIENRSAIYFLVLDIVILTKTHLNTSILIMSQFTDPVKTSLALYENQVSTTDNAIPVDVHGTMSVGHTKVIPVSVENSYLTPTSSDIPVVVNDGGDHHEYAHLIPEENRTAPKEEGGDGNEILPQNTTVVQTEPATEPAASQ